MRATEDGSLLGSFEGRRPDAPQWFEAALAQVPDRSTCVVHGAPIEMLTWGQRGRPGLLLLHGKMAHADWWSFVAPFFAAQHRVAALSFGGMGGSGWRDDYSVESMADEAMAVAEAAGLHDTGPPLVVAHSFGGFVSLRCAQRDGARLAGVVTVDMPLLSREQRAARTQPSLRQAIAVRPTRLYPTLAAALARFRFAPEQPCENLYIADHIARTSLKVVRTGSADAWTWRFDPRVAPVGAGDAATALREARCPVAVCWGGESALIDPGVVDHIASLAPASTPMFEIPGARHHVMVDQPLGFVGAMRGLLSSWPRRP